MSARAIGCADPPGANCVERSLLLIGERSIEVIHRGLHHLQRFQHGIQPFSDRCEPRWWRQPILC